MPTPAPQTIQVSRLSHLAGQLAQDIRRKGLRSGDPYLTAEAAASFLGVSRMTANRAMNVLAERELLVRHGSRGTFIGPAAEVVSEASVGKCIHYITFVDDNPTIHVELGEILAGLESVFPDVSLDTHVVPLRNAMQYVQKKLAAAVSDPALGGIILTLGTRAVQQLLADAAVPAVVNGSVYPGIRLPSVEVDQLRLGQLLAEMAINSGYRRLMFVGRELWRRGDNLAFDGIQEAAHAAGLGLNAVSIRNIPTSPTDLANEFDHILSEVEAPCALLCRLPCFARAAATAAARRGLRVPEDIGIVYDDTVQEGGLPFDAVRPQAGCSLREQFRKIGQMLTEMGAGRMPDPMSVVMPVEAVPMSGTSER
jgi:DNA-binding LacI/PurR family transcriptional regulator